MKPIDVHLSEVKDVKEGALVLIDKPLNWTSFDVVNAIQALREAEFRAVTLEVEIVQQKLALEQLVRGVASAPPAS